MLNNTGGAVDEKGAQVPLQERRYVYGLSKAAGGMGFPARPNKRGVRRNISTFNIILLLFGTGGAIVLYISNIIAINRLSFEVSQLQARYDHIISANASYRADVNRKSAWERISTIAMEEVGLRAPTQQPVWFFIDRDKLKELGDTTQNAQ